MSAKAEDESKSGGFFSWFNPLADDISLVARLGRSVALLVLLYFVAAPFVCWYEYDNAFKEPFNPVPADAEKTPPPAGAVFSGTLITLGDQLLEAWLPNDKLYPSVLLDNPQNYQLGVLEVLRYATRVLRDDLSRQRTTDKIDPRADLAFTAFSNNPNLWLFPAAEAKFSGGVKALREYETGLKNGSSNFYPRTDNLIVLVDQFASLLGGESTRLANAPRDTSLRLSQETAGDRNTEGEKVTYVKVPWSQIDDNFYHARGVAYGMREALLAARFEFRDVIKIKRSGDLLDSVIADLALAQFEPWMVLNGARDSMFANHSLTLMATMQDARQKLRSFADTMRD